MTIKIAGQIMLQAAPEIYPKFFSKKTTPAINEIKPKNIKLSALPLPLGNIGNSSN